MLHPEMILVKEWQLAKIQPAFLKLELGWISVSRSPTIIVVNTINLIKNFRMISMNKFIILAKILRLNIYY